MDGNENAAPETVLADRAAALYAVLAERIGPFVEACVLTRIGDAFGGVTPVQAERARDAGARAAAAVLPVLRVLLDADVDAQAATPLQVLRDAVSYATTALDAVAVPPLARDRFLAERFPEDRYDLIPASMGVLGGDVEDLAIAWGAAKALVHRRRHR
jgi:hypothetical protein